MRKLLLIFVPVFFILPDLHSAFTSEFTYSYNVSFYDLEIKLDARLQRIAGRNIMTFKPHKAVDRIRVDLHSSMQAARVIYRGKPTKFEHKDDQLIISFPTTIQKNVPASVEIFFSGSPQSTKSENLVWGKADRQTDIISLSPDLLEPHQWWPVKNDPSDLADSMRISVIFNPLNDVITPGQLRSVEDLPGKFRRWEFVLPSKTSISNVSIHIGEFVLVSDIYQSQSGRHELKAYVSRLNQVKAKEYLREIKKMIGFMEKYFGTYPFWKSGYMIVEGSARYEGISLSTPDGPGEAGFARSTDRKLLRQVAYDWFERALTTHDPKDNWIHETLYTYAEVLFLEEFYSADRAKSYLKEIRENIPEMPLQNEGDLPPDLRRMVGIKGAWVLQTLRTVTDNDRQFLGSIKDLYSDFQMKSVSSKEFYEYLSWKLGYDYVFVFQQFLRHSQIPEFHYRIKKKGRKLLISYRWEGDEGKFDLPVMMQTLNSTEQLRPRSDWQIYTARGLSEKQIFFDPVAGLYQIIKEK